jgi:hypothetical protein
MNGSPRPLALAGSKISVVLFELEQKHFLGTILPKLRPLHVTKDGSFFPGIHMAVAISARDALGLRTLNRATARNLSGSIRALGEFDTFNSRPIQSTNRLGGGI